MEMTLEDLKELMVLTAEDAVGQGLVDPASAPNDHDLFVSLFNILLPAGPEQASAAWLVRDHRARLLSDAEWNLGPFTKREHACVFYATWVEHSLNRIIVVLAKREQRDENAAQQLIRKTNLEDKVGWVLRLLGAKPFRPSIVRIVNEISELRNWYVHYKWRPQNSDIEMRLTQAVRRMPKVVRYVKAYEDRYIFRNQRRRIRRIMEARNWSGLLELVNKSRNAWP